MNAPRTCRVCGKLFIPDFSLKYCSIACKQTAQICRLKKQKSAIKVPKYIPQNKRYDYIFLAKLEQNLENPKDCICWGCTKATGQCSWSAFLRPVKGSKSDTKRGVYSCPEFESELNNFKRRYLKNGKTKI